MSLGVNDFERVQRDVLEYTKLENQLSDITTEDDLHFHENFKYVFFDSDISLVFRLVRLLAMVCKRMENRFINRSTVKVSKSVFHYLEKKNYMFRSPQVFYDFKFKDVRILIVRVRSSYRVDVLGVPVDSLYKDFKNDSQLFDSLGSAVVAFKSIVARFCGVLN